MMFGGPFGVNFGAPGGSKTPIFDQVPHFAPIFAPRGVFGGRGCRKPGNLPKKGCFWGVFGVPKRGQKRVKNDQKRGVPKGISRVL